MQIPHVSVILSSHLVENRPYLDLAIKALQASKGEVRWECLLLHDTDQDIALDDKRFRVYRDKTLPLHSDKIHRGFELMHPDSLGLILSDDVMVSEYFLNDMAEAFQGRHMIMNPFSNSDCTGFYEADIWIHELSKSLKLKPDMDLKDVEGFENAIIQYPRRAKCLVSTAKVSFYCTMIPKKTWDAVGGLDPKLEYRHNDDDFCIRASHVGVPSVVNFGAFAFHFGSKTLGKCVTHAMKDECSKHYLQKNYQVDHHPV